MKITATQLVIGGVVVYYLFQNRTEFMGAGSGAQSLDGSPTVVTSTNQNEKQYWSKWFEGTPAVNWKNVPSQIRNRLR
tara:strand:- start:1993 stop:2226 length:234 start_codon:yes stop_codon:yes gene_type:complete